MLYDFYFLTSEEASKRDDKTYWFKVGDILNLKTPAAVNNHLIANKLMNSAGATFANETLFKLWDVVHKAAVINYFLENAWFAEQLGCYHSDDPKR